MCLRKGNYFFGQLLCATFVMWAAEEAEEDQRKSESVAKVPQKPPTEPLTTHVPYYQTYASVDSQSIANSNFRTCVKR